MNVKKFVALALSLFLEGGVAVAAEPKGTVGEVKAEVKDASHGKGYGGLSGVMMGAASGGPIGAVVGAVSGMFAGGTAHHATAEVVSNTDEEELRDTRRTYIVHTEEGDIRVRSPNQVFQVGDKVEVVRGRLRAIN